MTSQCVDLISNHYRVHLTKTLFQYRIDVSLNDETLSADFDDQTPFLFVNKMKEKRAPLEWRRRIISAAVDEWLVAGKSELEDRFVKCNISCCKLIANFDLRTDKSNPIDTKLIALPYRHGNLRLSTLIFSVRLKKTEFSQLTLLNIAIGVDGCTLPTLAKQSSTSTTRYNANYPIPSNGSTLMVRGQIVKMKSSPAFGPVLSVCNTTGWFHEPFNESQNVMDYVKDNFEVIEDDDGLTSPPFSHLNDKLTGRRVEVSHMELSDLPKQVRISGLFGTARDHIGQEVVWEHFKKHYGVELEHLNWPCIVSKSKLEKLKIPMELCRLTRAERAPDQQVGLPALEPLDYFKQLEHYVKDFVDSNESNLSKIGLSIELEPIKSHGRVLDPIQLIGGNHWDDLDSKDDQLVASTAKFVRPVKLDKFRITLIGATRDSMKHYGDLREFIKEYCRVGKSYGVEISDYMTPVDIIVDENEDSLKAMLRKHVEQLNIQSFDHSIMVLADECDHLESYLHFLETQFDRPSDLRTRLSCLQLSYLKQSLYGAKNNDDTMLRDLWLRYNFQLGGMNYVLSPYAYQLLGDNFLVLGVDVLHPNGNEEFSVTSVVGLWSMNSERFSQSTQLQARSARYGNECSIEHVNDVGLLIERIFFSYSKKQNAEICLPSQILILLNKTSSEKLWLDEATGLDTTLRVLSERYDKIGQAEPSVSCFHIQQRNDVRFRLSSPIELKCKDDYRLPSGTVITDPSLLGQDTFALYAAPRCDFAGNVEPLIARKLRGEIPSVDDNYYQKLLHALCYLPSAECTNVPASIDLAEKASRRGKEIALVWKRECPVGDDWVDQLNAYFSSLDTAYLDTPFYA